MPTQVTSDMQAVSSIDIIGEFGDFLNEPHVRRNAATALAVQDTLNAARQLVALALDEESTPVRSHMEQALLKMGRERQEFARTELAFRLAEPAARALLGRLTMLGVENGTAPPDSNALLTLIELSYGGDPATATRAQKALLELNPEDEATACTLCEGLLSSEVPPSGLRRTLAQLRLDGFGRQNIAANRALADVALGRLPLGVPDERDRALQILTELTGEARDHARGHLAELVRREDVPADVYALLGRLRARGSLLGQPRYVNRNSVQPTVLERVVDAALGGVRRWVDGLQARRARPEIGSSPMKRLAALPVASRVVSWIARVQAAVRASAERSARVGNRFSYNRAFATFALGALGATIVGAYLDRVLTWNPPAAFHPLYVVGGALTAMLIAFLASRPATAVHVHYDRAAGWMADVLAAAPWLLLPCLLFVTVGLTIAESGESWTSIGFVPAALLLFVGGVRAGTMIAYPHTGWLGPRMGEGMTIRLLRVGLPVVIGASAGLVIANWVVLRSAGWLWGAVPRPIAFLWLVLIPSALPLAVAFTLTDESNVNDAGVRAGHSPIGQAPLFTGSQLLAIAVLLLPLIAIGNSTIRTFAAPPANAAPATYTASSEQSLRPAAIRLSTPESPVLVSAAFPQQASITFSGFESDRRRILAYHLSAQADENGVPVCPPLPRDGPPGDGRVLVSGDRAEFTLGWGCYAIRSELRATATTSTRPAAPAGVAAIFAEAAEKTAAWLSASVAAPVATDSANANNSPTATLELNVTEASGEAMILKPGSTPLLDRSASWVIETPHRVQFDAKRRLAIAVSLASIAGTASSSQRISLLKVGAPKESSVSFLEDVTLPNALMFVVNEGRYEIDLAQGSRSAPLPASSVVNIFAEELSSDRGTFGPAADGQRLTRAWLVTTVPTTHRFTVAFGQRVSIHAEADGEDVVVELLDQKGVVLQREDDPEKIERWLEAGTYDVRVAPFKSDEPSVRASKGAPESAARYDTRLAIVLNVDRGSRQ